ncbi:XRE family transcriptional regulator [Peribacillus glennii]|uniref:XRE family transcriptional regulator n=2 Tax=Peribacillus glennii TaxID=2303991 RepID=A0A372L8F3_9BACI|nr:XRE family transcriptional regulator [Peribacillus glennii]
MLKSNIGELIKQSKYKREFIMNELNVSANTLSNWCTGKSMPSLYKAFKLAEILGCMVDDLYEK